MVNPSAAEVAAKRTIAMTEAAQTTPKSHEEEEVLNAVHAKRPRAIDVIDELRHATRKMEPGTARNIMRSYGVEFEALPGEPPEVGGGNPPAGGGGTPPPPTP